MEAEWNTLLRLTEHRKEKSQDIKGKHKKKKKERKKK